MKGERARGAADMVGSDVNAVAGTNEWVALVESGDVHPLPLEVSNRKPI